MISNSELRTRIVGVLALSTMISSGKIAAAATFVPASAGNHSWAQAGNWDAAVPNAIGASAILNDHLNGSRFITLDAPTTVGNLTINSPNAAPAQNVIVGDATNTLTFQVASGNATFNNLGTSTANSATTVVQAPVILNSDLVLNQTDRADYASGMTFVSGLSGSAARTLTKNGIGNLSITANSPNYLGKFAVNEGALRITGNYLTGASDITVQDGAQLSLTLGDVTSDVSLGAGGVLRLNGQGKPSGATPVGAFRVHNQNSILNFKSEIELQATDSRIFINGLSQLTLSRRVFGAGGWSKSGSGVLIFAGTESNEYQGTATHLNGLLRLAKTNGAVAISSDLAINLSESNNGYVILDAPEQIGNQSRVSFGGVNSSLRLNGHSETVGRLFSLVGNGAIENLHASSNSVLTIAASAGSSVYGGALRDGSGGSLAVVKTGGSTQALAGDNSYTGGTTVSGGTLLASNVSGSATGYGSVLVQTGGTLGGSGIISAPVQVTDGALEPGDQAVGTLTLGNTSLAANSILRYEFAAPGVAGGGVNDLIAVNGNLTLDGTLNVSALTGFAAGTYRLFDFGGGSFTNNGLVVNLPAGFAGTVSTAIANQVNLVVTGSAASLDGDFNHDGKVDAADYTVWRDGLGGPYTQNDYTLWKSNFGASLGSGSLATSPVPEPTAMIAVVAAIVFGCGAGRLRRDESRA